MYDALRKAAEERERRRRRGTEVREEPPTPEEAVGGGETSASHGNPPEPRNPGDAVDVEAPVEAPARGLPDSSQGEDSDFLDDERLQAEAVEVPLVRRVPRGSGGGPAGRTAPAGRPRRHVATPPGGRLDERLVCVHDPRDPRAEKFRSLRANLMSLSPAPRSILVASGARGEGKSLVAANLATTLAEEGRMRVLLVDANLREPELPELFGTRSAPGLSACLLGAVESPADLVLPTGVMGVELLPPGELPPNPGALWVGHALKKVLSRIPEDYDFVVVDTPCLEAYADASVMGPDVDGVLMVVRIQGAPKEKTERGLDALEAGRARLLGAFATDAR